MGERYTFDFPEYAAPCDAGSEAETGGCVAGDLRSECEVRSGSNGAPYPDCTLRWPAFEGAPRIAMPDATTITLSVGNAWKFRLVVESASGDVLASTTVISTVTNDGCCGTRVAGDVVIP
jgi:hypothetical protein